MNDIHSPEYNGVLEAEVDADFSVAMSDVIEQLRVTYQEFGPPSLDTLESTLKCVFAIGWAPGYRRGHESGSTVKETS